MGFSLCYDPNWNSRSAYAVEIKKALQDTAQSSHDVHVHLQHGHIPSLYHQTGGQLGSPSGARRRTYERLKQHVERTKDTILPPPPELYSAMEEIYRYPLQETARDTLNRQLRSGIDDDQLASLVMNLREDNRLCQVHEQLEPQEPQIMCSLGLFEDE